MSEKAEAFGREDEPSTAHDSTTDAIVGNGSDPRPDIGAGARSEPLTGSPASAPESVDPVGDDDTLTDGFAAALLVGDRPQFLRGLVLAIAHAKPLTDDLAVLGIVLRRIGAALMEGDHEVLMLQGLVEALSQQRVRRTALFRIAPLVAALVARVAAEPRLQDASPAIQDEVQSLMRAAEELVEAALKAGGARAWHRLPEIAASISRRVARRDLSISALPEALSRLGARFGVGLGDAFGADMDHPRGSFPRGGPAAEARRMVISGPVEIVILDR